MRSITTICMIMLAWAVGAQTITGTIRDEMNNPLPFATVYLDETFEGVTANENGYYQLQAANPGKYTLVVSSVGFTTLKQPVDLNGEVELNIQLQPEAVKLNEVVISAGAFRASAEAKSTMLEPLDIVMNAAAEGDIYQAMETLPGVSQVGDQTGLFVRGGDSYETKTLIDGAVAENPFFSEVPNVSSRSRFDPFLFKGTTFTTGGYSAEYGRALSSVLILETEDIPDRTSSSIGVNMAGVDLAHTEVWKDNKTALIGGVNYTNLAVLFGLVPQNVDWKTVPQGVGTNWAFRHKSANGMFKSFLQHQRGKTGINTTNFENRDEPILYAYENSTTFWNTNYEGILSDKWSFYAGVSYNNFGDDIRYDAYEFSDKTRVIHGKSTFFYDMNESASLKMGGEVFLEEYGDGAISIEKVNDTYTAFYAEQDITLSEKWALRVGGRIEHSGLLTKMNAAPRTSLAYKTGKYSQVSFAYGQFYQRPEDQFLYQEQDLAFERSSHYIANYQWIKDDQSFRIELYDKEYQSLIREEAIFLTNEGHGFSRGIDFFWKDEKTIDGLDYWLSYSYIDAERDYRDFPVATTPTFVTNHTFNAVLNYRIDHLNITPGMTYTYASGRAYYNPNNEHFLADRTTPYHNLNMNVSYVTSLLGNFAVVYASAGNPFGFDQVFDYLYSADGTERVAIGPSAKRSFFVGVFVNFR